MFLNCFASNDIEQIIITPKMEDSILATQFKANLRTNNGEQFTVYLYAQDEERKEKDSYSRITGEEYHTISKKGHFYIYLYDVKNKSFSNYRTKIFSGFSETRFNDEGSNIIVLSGSKAKKSDVLLISQFGTSKGDFYEAYGFSKNNAYLKKCDFLRKYKNEEFSNNQFYGQIGKEDGPLHSGNTPIDGFTEIFKNLNVTLSEKKDDDRIIITELDE